MGTKKIDKDKIITDEITKGVQSGLTPSQALKAALAKVGERKNIHAPVNIATPSTRFDPEVK